VTKSGLLQFNALIRYHFNVDPNALADEEFAELIAALKWVKENQN